MLELYFLSELKSGCHSSVRAQRHIPDCIVRWIPLKDSSLPLSPGIEFALESVSFVAHSWQEAGAW